MSAQEVLNVENLTKSFGNQIVLHDMSFKINKGEVVVILGPSGCGKSTFLRCLNMLEDINSGKIRLDGTEVSVDKKTVFRIREKIGMVFQNYELFPHLNILDNIILAPRRVQKRNKDEVKEEALKLLNRVGLQEKAKAYPRELSGGQKQRVAIVRALIMHPEILLLDEITAALDPEMVREVLKVVQELAAEGMTMVIVTHEMEFAKAVADRIVFIDKGCVVEETTPGKFFTNPKTKRAQQFLSSFHYESQTKQKDKIKYIS